jgi:NTE family protein
MTDANIGPAQPLHAAPPAEQGIGLCLSGGGFRATLFNLGALWRLNDAGMLPRLNMITSVSGGSIASGVLAMAWPKMQFDGGVATNFKELVTQPLQTFCGKNIAVPAAVLGLLNPLKSIGDEMVGHYRDLVGESTLQDLPSSPIFVFYATNLQTGSSFQMTRECLSDYKIGKIVSPDTPLAKVVAASSAFPPVLSPQILEVDARSWQPTQYATITDENFKSRLVLSDGGVYDNMGLEAAWHRWSTVLVSDAGAPLWPDANPPLDWARQLARVLDVVTDQTRALRKRWLVDDLAQKVRRGAYWGIRSQVQDFGLPDPVVRDNDLIASLAHIRTQLDPFSDEEQGHLINWGYGICDTALRRWLTDEMPIPKIGSIPFPEFSIS